MKLIEYFGGEGVGAARSAMPLTPAVRAGDFVFISGQVPMDPNGEILVGSVEAQTRLVMDRIAVALEQAGSSMKEIVKSTVFLKDARDFTAFNKIYSSYFEPGKRPARTCVQNDMIVDIKVEIEVIAYSPR
ncbi:RidA family protein [Arvimicrobium flavum]|uniref:RidA family protein n=1 Tax=Arvimicrobium flavum TaxID=3393320 RepID=UPI00237A1062|nr:RidA family protein [Mesorhizobium shangrilense]